MGFGVFGRYKTNGYPNAQNVGATNSGMLTLTYSSGFPYMRWGHLSFKACFEHAILMKHFEHNFLTRPRNIVLQSNWCFLWLRGVAYNVWMRMHGEQSLHTAAYCTALQYIALHCCIELWCGVVWCGVVWCGVVWWGGVGWGGVGWGVVWCGVVWCGVVWCGVVWCGVVWCGVVWCGVVWCGVVWCGVVWCGVVWERERHEKNWKEKYKKLTNDDSRGAITLRSSYTHLNV